LNPQQNKLENEERLVISAQSCVNQEVGRRLLHVGLHGYPQSISFTSCLLPKYQSPTASAIDCYANNRRNLENISPSEDRENQQYAIAMYSSHDLNLTLSPSLGEIGECHVILNGV
jgi:hypothetical protein